MDTSGWVAKADQRDPHHGRVCAAEDRWLEGGGAILLSTDYVLDETLTLLRARIGLAAAQRWWEDAAASPRIRWEWIDPSRAERARTWFFRWTDKEFSFTDCTSFAVMKELRLKTALATDRHFRLAGFDCVP